MQGTWLVSGFSYIGSEEPRDTNSDPCTGESSPEFHKGSDGNAKKILRSGFWKMMNVVGRFAGPGPGTGT
jgi:hypothetical protein